MRRRGEDPRGASARAARSLRLACALLVPAALGLASGCGLTVLRPGDPRGIVAGGEPAPPPPPAPSETARLALDAGDLPAAAAAIDAALADAPPVEPGKAYPGRAELLGLRAELEMRRGRFAEGEADAAAAMALVPASTWPLPEPADPRTAPADPALPAPAGPPAQAPPPAPRKEPTQRSIHFTIGMLLEDLGRDADADRHLASARDLCLADPALADFGDCERERLALVRLRTARGAWAEAEPLVLARISEVQARHGAYDLRLSQAFCEAARFYCRQGKYSLCGPLYARSFDLWKTLREEAFHEHARAVQAGEPSPFDLDFLRPRAGHAPFAAPCGLEDQAPLLYKLGKPKIAAEAIDFERKLWAGNTEAAETAAARLASLLARSAGPLEVAEARHAVAFIAFEKGDLARAEEELRQVLAVYDEAWPRLPVSARRDRVQDYLKALATMVELLRSSGRFHEAVTLGERAVAVAEKDVDPWDAVRLDTLLSAATTWREMRDPVRSEESAGRYLDAVVAARGDRSPDYAWALRVLSYAYVLRDELDASQRMEMQARAIWAREDFVAPGF